MKTSEYRVPFQLVPRFQVPLCKCPINISAVLSGGDDHRSQDPFCPNSLKILEFLIFNGPFFFQKINITKFENCHEFSNYSVDVLNVSYEYDADGLCDIIHGSYTIHKVDLRGYELLTTAYECPTASTEQCEMNPREMVEQMHCDRFHSDNTGPWYMLAQAIKGSRCGEDVVSIFCLLNVIEYLIIL